MLPKHFAIARRISVKERMISTNVTVRNVVVVVVVVGIALALVSGVARSDESMPDSAGIKFFETRIRPLLLKNCGDCHGAEDQESDLRVDTYTGMINGGVSGPLIVPGNVKESLLISVIEYQNEALQMPPDEKLSEDEIQLLKKWVTIGAPHPAQNEAVSMAPRRSPIDLTEARRYWAFQPIISPDAPTLDGNEWVKTPVDAFILKMHQKQNLAPVAPADKLTLIRRATFDLTGLPPTPEEISVFLADTSPSAYEKVLDRLLDSPRYGERWGRHWLDVVRYADSNGQDENQAFVDAWRFRDYVIKSFNDDKPFNDFLIEQIAGDLLFQQKEMVKQPDGSLVPKDDDFELLIASGFLSLGPKVLAEKDFVKKKMDIVDEQIDAIGQAVLGLTLACARCHDHKFDPISTADYYAVAGILKSTKTMRSMKTNDVCNEYEIATAEERKQKRLHDELIKQKNLEISAVIAEANAKLAANTEAGARNDKPKDAEQYFPEETKTALKSLRSQLASIKKMAVPLPTAMGVTEGTPSDLQIHVRGSHLTLGKTVKRGVPAVLEFDGGLTLPENVSGRLELAKWLSHARNPLTARVAVNRIWRWHFGKGIVPTTNNFGKLGEVPTHPELLDWLASEFVRQGWSFKSMHKLLMLSNTYQLSSRDKPHNSLIDVENRFYWRADVRRLEAEAIRDSLLAASGLLDTTMGGSILNTPKGRLVFNHRSTDPTTYDTNIRSVYLPVVRNNLYDVFSLFDYSSTDIPLGDRPQSTIAPQALFMMNSPLIKSVSTAMADRLMLESATDEERVDRLYKLALGRPPSHQEQARFLDYVGRFESMLSEVQSAPNPKRAAWSACLQGVFASNEFIYVN